MFLVLKRGEAMHKEQLRKIELIEKAKEEADLKKTYEQHRNLEQEKILEEVRKAEELSEKQFKEAQERAIKAKIEKEEKKKNLKEEKEKKERGDAIERELVKVQNALDRASVKSNPFFSGLTFGNGVNTALTQQIEKIKEKRRISINAANIATTLSSFMLPELEILNTIVGAAGTIDDISNDNYIQSMLGGIGILAPLIKEFNPTFRTYNRYIDSSGVRHDVPVYHELGKPGYYISTAAGLTGDTYGFIVDDGAKIIK